MSEIGKMIVRGAASIGALAGLWLVISPWVWLGPYPATSTWDGFGVGLVVMILMGIKTISPANRWIGWVGIVIGLWTLFSPWALRFAGDLGAQINYTITAVALILACSGLVLATEATADCSRQSGSAT